MVSVRQAHLQVHHGHTVERTKLRRMALDVEQQAMQWAERQRKAALEQVSSEARSQGGSSLMLEGDGGKVRTGKLVPCEPEDPGFGKTTSFGAPRRKRPTHYRELITLDVRPPGAMESSAMDVVVPVLSEPGERARRMLACAARSGLGENTEVHGLGDMGSELASSFDEAFFDYPGSWSADWTHTRDYVDNAAQFLEGIDAGAWTQQLKDSIWARDVRHRNELCHEAKKHRMETLPAKFRLHPARLRRSRGPKFEKCPVAAVTTYLHNNWQYMHFAEKKAQSLPIVSARAEAQVRDRTKDRYCVAGAWSEENLESKATMRAIIADGRWATFSADYIKQSHTESQRLLLERLQQAVEQGRLCGDLAQQMLR